MKQNLRVIALDVEGNIVAVVAESTLARDAEKSVDELNAVVGTKKFDNLGLDTEIDFFDWARAEKVTDIPTVAELIAQATAREEVATVSMDDTRAILANGGSLLDLMYA